MKATTEGRRIDRSKRGRLMAATIYYQKNVWPKLLRDKTIAIIG